MSTSLRIDDASGGEVANQAPTISSAIIKAEQSTKEAVSSLIGSSARLAPVILQGSPRSAVLLTEMKRNPQIVNTPLCIAAQMVNYDLPGSFHLK